MAENKILNWRESLTMHYDENGFKGKASFRKAYFFVKDTDTNFGRRNIVHQYPLKDTPYIEDIGADTDQFSIQGYVVQNSENDQNYFDERDALIAALKEKGPGQLWHPFLGIINVSLIGKAELKESFQEGGIARFSMTFVRAEEPSAPFPKTITNHIETLDTGIDEGTEVFEDDMENKYEAEEAPGKTVSTISNALTSLNKMLSNVTTAIQGAFPAQISDALGTLSAEYLGVNVFGAINNACSLAGGIIGMGNGLLSLIGSYGDILTSQMFGACSGAIRGLSNSPWGGAQVEEISEIGGFISSTMSKPTVIGEDYGKSVTRAALALTTYGESPDSSTPSKYGGTLPVINIISPVSAQQSANQILVVNLVRFLGITIAMRAAVRINYTSHNAVIEILNEIIDAVNALLLKLGNESSNTEYSDYNINVSNPGGYQALNSLKKIFTESMLGITGPLAKIIEYKVPPDTISSLTVAYNNYGDLNREKEIIDRNRPLIKHPGFLPGGRVLELLNA